MNIAQSNGVRDMQPGEEGYCLPEAVCTSYRIALSTGRRQEKVDFQKTPIGQGTSYFLYLDAMISPKQTDDAVIRVGRRQDGCVIEIPESVTFRPQPSEQPPSGLIPIVNEEYCMRANGIPLG